MRRETLKTSGRSKIVFDTGYVTPEGDKTFWERVYTLSTQAKRTTVVYSYTFDSWNDFTTYINKQYSEITGGTDDKSLKGRANQIVARKCMEADPDSVHMSFSVAPQTKLGSLMRFRKFYNNDSMEDFINKLNHGSPEITRLVEKHCVEIEAAAGIVTPVREPRTSLTGPEFLIDRYKAGDPECTFELHDSHETTFSCEGKVVELAASMQFLSDINPVVALYRGAAIVALIGALESAGYSVGFTMFTAQPTYCHREMFFTKVRLKSQDQPLDVDAISMAMCDSDMYRRGTFLLYEESLGHPSGLWSGWSATSVYEGVRRSRNASLMSRYRKKHRFFLDRIVKEGVEGRVEECIQGEPYSQAVIPNVSSWMTELGLREEMFKKDLDSVLKMNARWLADRLEGFGIEISQNKEVSV